MRKYISLHTTMSEEKKEILARLRERTQARRKAIAESGLTPAEYDEMQYLESLTHEELQEVCE